MLSLRACGLWCARSPQPPATWQCNQDGSVSQAGVIVEASLPCNWGLTEASQPVEGPRSTTCAAAELLAAIESKMLSRRNLQVTKSRAPSM